MAGGSYTPGMIPLARPAVSTFVKRFGGAILPNIRCMGISFLEGPETNQATFRYVFDTGGGVDTSHAWPTAPEQVLPPNASGPYVVAPDDRLLVYAVTSAGMQVLMFDGFAAIPAGTISANHDKLTAHFVAQGTPVRCWDNPMFGRVQRDANQYSSNNTIYLSVITSSPIVFNPAGLGNATLTGTESTLGSFQSAVFLDELFVQDNQATPVGQSWTLPMAVKYVLAQANGNEPYIDNPDFTKLDALLDARTPINGQTYDPNNPATYTSEPIILKQLDITGMTWPEALNKLIYRYGFRMRFVLSQDSSGDPIWTLKIARLDGDKPQSYQQLYIQSGGTLDPSQTNVGEMHLTYDQTDVANAYVVETAAAEYEIPAVLAPLFRISPTDATTLGDFIKGSPTFKGNENYYRLYGFDECGEGHTDVKTGNWITGAQPSLTSVLGYPAQGGPGPPNPNNYTNRRRPGSSQLLSTTATEDPLPAILLISWNYTGPSPGIWDGSGTWWIVSKTWKMMSDRLGIYLDCDNPDAWPVNNLNVEFGVNAASKGSKVCGVRAQCVAGETRFYLMLVTVIKGDQVAIAEANKVSSSPSQFTIQRVIDARERYAIQWITANSWYNATNQPISVRNDYQNAVNDAEARRAANEMPRISGPVVIPRFSTVYSVGNRLTGVVGRTLNLQTNVGDSSGQGPIYPRIIGVEWSFEPKQMTTLTVTDDRGWKTGAAYGSE